MANGIFMTTDKLGRIVEYKQVKEGNWLYRVDFQEWLRLKRQPPEVVLAKAKAKSAALQKSESNKVIPIKRDNKGIGLSGYKSFFIGNAEWYGNKFFASLPPSGPWIIQYVLSQIIRDTSRSHEFNNAGILKLLSRKHYLWANLSIQKIVDKTAASKNTVMRVMKAAEESGCILTVPGQRKNIDNNVYICGIKSYHEYSGDEEKQEWLFVDTRYAAEDGKIPGNILAPLRNELTNRKVSSDGMTFLEELFS